MKIRRQKKRAKRAGLSLQEFELIELLEEILERLSMLEILSFANNFLITDRKSIPQEERDRIFDAALRAVEPESNVHEWIERLGRIKGEVLEKKRAIRRERRKERRQLKGDDK